MTCHTFDKIVFQGLGYNYRLPPANKVKEKIKNGQICATTNHLKLIKLEVLYPGEHATLAKEEVSTTEMNSF